jgi:two-component system, NtrC family, sensor kinase
MSTESPKKTARKDRNQLLNEALPQFEQFIESRESYIKALETTIQALKQENQQFTKNNLDIRNSIDELVAMQQLSNIVSTAMDAEVIVGTLFELTGQVIPGLDANIFLFDADGKNLVPLSSKSSVILNQEAQSQLEAGIVDWVLSEKKTVIIPDLSNMLADGTVKNFVIVPLILRSDSIGVYFIHTDKAQQEFSNQDIQLLTVLANQAAAGVENWRAHEQLIKVNEELKTSQAQMVQAAKLAAIGELAASIAHEIKNPLQVLMLQIDMYKRGKPLPNWFDMFSKEVRRLFEITRRLMNFSRNISEDFPMEPASVNRAIEDVVAIVQHEFRNHKIEIEMNLNMELPAIMGSANYLQQVFLNLLINARDAMPDGGKINIVSTRSESNLLVKVSDTGMGIGKENIEKIFKPFFSTKGEKGTGLGLSICNKIISQHDGKMSVESVVGAGTTFTISLPIWRMTS